MQITGWNQRTMPLMEGTVEYVSVDAVKLANDKSAFVVQVKIDKAAGPGTTEPLRPGMQTVVYLRTLPRTVLDYILESAIDSVRSALCESN